MPALLLALSLLLAGQESFLPPLSPWNGASVSLIAKKSDPWITPAELSGFRTTPTYDETHGYLRRLEAAAPELRLVSIGKSAQGRELWMVIASKDRAFTPEAMRAGGKPILLVQAGIHSGEIDGKDAGLMLLRDMTVGRKRAALLDRANLLFVPIFNVDGHERSSPFNRINQRGPENLGWRSTARNLNLNRDYMKADAPEMRAMIAAIGAWQPDLYIDVHVTDGVDYQYDITWGHERPVTARSPAIARWLTERFDPPVRSALSAKGHIPGPLVFPVNDVDFEQGISGAWASPRYSTGYGDTRHLGTILVENHSLKPYRQRVLGTYVLLEAALDALGSAGGELRRASEEDRGLRPDPLVVAYDRADSAQGTARLDAIESQKELSPISGSTVVQWTGKPATIDVAVWPAKIIATVRRPKAYWVPPAWPEVIERLALHGIAFERIEAPRTLEVEMYRINDAKLDEFFEGHARMKATPVAEKRTMTWAPGSVRVPADQPLGDLASMLLEPASPDSFFQWGFFLEVLQRVEYAEAYVIEPMAKAMLEEDPALRAEFEKKLADDAAFRGDPAARLRWFYDRSPYADTMLMLYPVGRE